MAIDRRRGRRGNWEARTCIRPLASRLAHRYLAKDLAADSLEYLVQALARDRQAVIAEADHRVTGIGFLADKLGHGFGQLEGAAGVIDVGGLDPVHPGMDVHDGAD